MGFSLKNIANAAGNVVNTVVDASTGSVGTIAKAVGIGDVYDSTVGQALDKVTNSQKLVGDALKGADIKDNISDSLDLVRQVAASQGGGGALASLGNLGGAMNLDLGGLLKSAGVNAASDLLNNASSILKPKSLPISTPDYMTSNAVQSAPKPTNWGLIIGAGVGGLGLVIGLIYFLGKRRK